jgi:hypothetical protein
VETRIEALLEHTRHCISGGVPRRPRSVYASPATFTTAILQVLAGTPLHLRTLAGADRNELPARIEALPRWLVEEQRELRAFIRQLEPGAEPNDLGTVDLAAISMA